MPRVVEGQQVITAGFERAQVAYAQKAVAAHQWGGENRGPGLRRTNLHPLQVVSSAVRVQPAFQRLTVMRSAIGFF